jgi:hypothetical protein
MNINTYKFSKIQQIIPLIENVLNFKLNLIISTKNNSPFTYSITTEEDLENNSYEFKTENDGFVNIEVTSNDNTMRNYLLLIKSEKDDEFTINKTIENVEARNEKKTDNDIISTEITKQPSNNQDKQKTNYIWYVLIFILILFFIFILFSENEEICTRTKPLPVTDTSNNINEPVLSNPETSNNINESFLSNINNLNTNNKSFLDRLNEMEL